ncbi:hypothetical protein Tco_0555903 [Tanacetum coccineum]
MVCHSYPLPPFCTIAMQTTSFWDAKYPNTLSSKRRARQLGLKTLLPFVSIYTPPARSMMIALNAKNKLKIVTGEYNEPEANSRNRALWERTNDMIISWILNTIAEKISNSLNSLNTASGLWNELQEHYLQLDGHRIYQITNDLGQWRKRSKKETNSILDEVICKCQGSGYIDATHAYTCKGLQHDQTGGEAKRSKEGHSSEECYKIVGYPIGHPLHGKYKPNAQRNNMPRTVDMTQTTVNTRITQEGNSGSNGHDMAVSARMDQLHNKLNQMMQHNSKEQTGVGSFNSATDTQSMSLYQMDKQHKTITRGLLMAPFVMVYTSSKQEKPTPQSLALSINNHNHHLWHARLGHRA